MPASCVARERGDGNTPAHCDPASAYCKRKPIMATPAPADPREALWEASFVTYYDTLFEEMASEGLVTGWSRFDDVTKVLVTLTASGSAISGWALWSRPGYRLFFVLLTGLAGLLSLLSTSLAITGRIKAHVDSNRRFGSLRVDLETFRMKMKLNPDFDLEAFAKEFEVYRKRYGETLQLRSIDTFRTRGFDKSIQKQQNIRLNTEILESE
jgi:hypothetical protein